MLQNILYRQGILEDRPARASRQMQISGATPLIPIRILIVCNLFKMPYRIMRCAKAAGADIYILGNRSARGFRSSRYPRKLILSNIPFNGTPTQEALDEINHYVAEFGIDMVMPGDAPSTRTVVALKDRISVPCFPLPDLKQFDIMNNKWIFTQICQELGILCPQSRLFKTKEDLLSALEANEITFPSMVKALAMDGNHGVLRIDAHNAYDTVKTITYNPILVQDFIPGEDIGASVYCENGIIHSYILHRLQDFVYSTFDNDSVRHTLARFMNRMGSDGVYNFDMRLTDDGRIYYLECNPRFFYKINLSMLAGINFVQAGLNNKAKTPSSAAKVAIRIPSWSLLKVLLKPWHWRVTRHNLAMLVYTILDPLPFFRELLRMDPESDWIDLHTQNEYLS